MKWKMRFICAFSIGAFLAATASDVTNTVLMVDQRGNLNVEGVASVEDVATNAAKAVVAEQKAETAQQTAQAAQALHAGTIQQQLTSGTDQSEGSGDEPKKQGWFSRLFRG